MSLETKAEVIHTHMDPVRYRCERGTVKKAERKRRVRVTRGAEQAPGTPWTSRETSKWSLRAALLGHRMRRQALCKEARMLGKWKTAGERKA